jgi:hypothetical protein
MSDLIVNAIARISRRSVETLLLVTLAIILVERALLARIAHQRYGNGSF